MTTLASHRGATTPLAGRPRRELTLRVFGPLGDVRVVRLRSAKCTIGSGPNCTLRIRAPGVGPLCCYIVRGEHGAFVRRLSADTLLNGRAFGDSPLSRGDRLSLGPLELEVLDCGVEVHPPTSEAAARASTPATDADRGEADFHPTPPEPSLLAAEREQLREQQARLQQVEGELAELHAQLDNERRRRVSECDAWTEHRRRFEAETEHRRRQLEQKIELLTQLEQELERLQAARDAERRQWETQRESLDAQLQARDAALAEQAELETTLRRSQEQTVDRWRQEAIRLREEVRRLEADRLTWAAHDTAAQEGEHALVEQWRGEIATVERALAEEKRLHQQAASRQRQLERQAEQQATQLTALEAEIDSLHQEAAAARQQTASAQTEQQAAARRWEAERAQWQADRQRLAELEQQCRELADELSQRTEELHAQRAQEQARERESAVRETERAEQLRQDDDNRAAALAAQEQELAARAEQAEMLLAEATRREIDLARQQADLLALADRLAMERTDSENVRAMLDAERAELAEQRRQLAAMPPPADDAANHDAATIAAAEVAEALAANADLAAERERLNQRAAELERAETEALELLEELSQREAQLAEQTRRLEAQADELQWRAVQLDESLAEREPSPANAAPPETEQTLEPPLAAISTASEVQPPAEPVELVDDDAPMEVVADDRGNVAPPTVDEADQPDDLGYVDCSPESPVSTADVLTRLAQAGIWKDEADAEEANVSEPAISAPEREHRAEDDSNPDEEGDDETLVLPGGETPPEEGAPTASTTVAAATTAGTTGLTGEEDIEEYMVQLLQRMRGEPEAVINRQRADEAYRPAPVREPSPVAAESATPKLAPLLSLEEFRPRAQAPELASHMQQMRELVNSTTRSAIDTHKKRFMWRKSLSSLGIAAAATGVSGWLIWATPAGSLKYGLVGSVLTVSLFWGYRGLRSLADYRRMVALERTKQRLQALAQQEAERDAAVVIR